MTLLTQSLGDRLGVVDVPLLDGPVQVRDVEGQGVDPDECGPHGFSERASLLGQERPGLLERSFDGLSQFTQVAERDVVDVVVAGAAGADAGSVEGLVGNGEVVRGHAHTVALDDEVHEYRMRDTFGGYDWGDPIVLWSWPRAPRPEFTVAQMLLAERVLSELDRRGRRDIADLLDEDRDVGSDVDQRRAGLVDDSEEPALVAAATANVLDGAGDVVDVDFGVLVDERTAAVGELDAHAANVAVLRPEGDARFGGAA